MDEDLIIYLKLDTYLAQWVVHEYGEIVEFPRNSAENDVIQLGLMRKPILAYVPGPGEGYVPIKVPYFKERNIRIYNYLSYSGRKSLARCIRSRFVIALWNDLHKFGHIGRQKQDLIWTWMEAHGIDTTETNFNTLFKIYKRKRDVYRHKMKETGKEVPRGKKGEKF